MHDEQKLEQYMRWLVFPLLLLVFLAQFLSCRGLFADGANFLLGILNTMDFPWWDPQRIINHLVTKWPAVLAIKLGIYQLSLLRCIFCWWLVLCPILLWGFALWALRRDVMFWPFVLMFSFVYFNTAFFAIGEFNLCFAALAFCFARMLLPVPKEWPARAGFLFAALLLSLDYPATLFSGSLLFLYVFLKPEEEWNGAPRWYRFVLAALFVLSVASAMWEVIAPRDPANFAGARSMDVLRHDLQFWYLGAYAVFAVMGSVMKPLWSRVAIVGLGVVLLWLDLTNIFRILPSLHYEIRAFMSLAVSGWFLFLWIMRRYVPVFSAPQVTLFPAVLSLVLLGFLSTLDIEFSLDFMQYLDGYTRLVNAGTGVIPLESSDVMEVPGAQRFSWGWTFPLMSVILRANSQKAIIANRAGYTGYQPFDPYKNIPDLDRYYR